MDGAATGSDIPFAEAFRGGIMAMRELEKLEEDFIKEVLDELTRYQIDSVKKKEVKGQLTEHFLEARQHGEHGLEGIGTSSDFVKEFIEVNGMRTDPMRPSAGHLPKRLIYGSGAMVITFLLSQLILAMFLTDSLSPGFTDQSFSFNLVYRISNNTWWNSLLILISLSVASLATVMTIKYVPIRRVGLK